ncbi:DUF6053 domain-containing protein [Lysobacter enzymogenes]|uniref:DUF6053 domain-containing protein n=1 Tax=Lysobacter enzymogenes TaxID=69 RepID=UPI003D18DAF6
MGGPSGPMPCAQVAAIGNKSIGPEGPPTTARHRACRPAAEALRTRRARSAAAAIA